MPVTFAHPAFAWPLRRWGLAATPLVVGALVPDVAHLLPRSPWTDHTALSLFTFALPLGWLLSLLVERVLGPGWARLAPERWSAPLAQSFRPHTPLAPTAGAVFAGALTHILLDHVTHAYGAGARILGFHAQIPIFDLPIYRALQYGLGVIGSVLVARSLVRWDHARGQAALSPEETRPLWVLAAGIGLFAVVWGHRRSSWLPLRVRIHDFAVESVACTLVLTAVVLLLLGLIGAAMQRSWPR